MEAIGIIHSPFKNIEDMPIQLIGAVDFEGTMHIDDQYKIFI